MSALGQVIDGLIAGSMPVPAEHAIGQLDAIPRGEGRNFEVAGRTVAVFRNHRDEVFASQPECPHRQGPLADGMLGGSTIMCPLHDRMFDLDTGAAVGGGCPIAVYPARVGQGGAVYVTV